METPKETIISVARENRIWKWVTIILSIGTACSALALYGLLHKPQQVWMVTEDGKISNNSGKYFSFEIEKAVQRAIDAYYISSPDRENLLEHYFEKTLAESAKNFKTKDRFISFKVNKIEESGPKILTQGTLYRENEKDERLDLILDLTERSDINPFGLVVSSATSQKTN